MIDLLILSLGGGLGAVARWGIDRSVPRPSGGFPVGITVVNVLGSFALGVLVGWEGDALGVVDSDVVGIGVLGGFTTFSTWMVDIDLAPTAESAARIVGVPLVSGVAAAAIGVLVGSSFG